MVLLAGFDAVHIDVARCNSDGQEDLSWICWIIV